MKKSVGAWLSSFGFAVGLCGAAVADAVSNPLMEVAADETLAFNYSTNNCKAVIHGTVNFVHASTATRPTWLVRHDDFTNNATRIDLAPDVGDVGKLNVKFGIVGGNGGVGYSNVAKCSFYVGANGGGDQACLSLGEYGEAAMYFTRFELCANATTSAEVFDALQLTAHGAYFRSTEMVNSNTKPLRITFSNSTGNSPRPRIGGFWDSSYFKMPNEGGDIILRGSGATSPIYFYSQQTKYNLFSGTPKGFLRTTGPCDVWFELESYDHTKHTSIITINATNLVWGHTGNFCVRGYGGVKTSYDNVLPFGSTTGVVRVEGGVTLTKLRSFLDLNGTTQSVNGVELVNGGILTNSANRVATVIMGRDNVDGALSGTFDAPRITYRKEGSGTLTLGGGSIPALAVDGGTLVVAGAMHVGTLALTNVTVSCRVGGELTYDTLLKGDGVAQSIVSAETNVVVQLVGTLGDATIDKTGAGFLTCQTLADAQGAPLNVRAGVLRFGGVSCTNRWWRFIVKKAMKPSKTFTSTDMPSFAQPIHLMLGSIGLFSPEGLECVKGSMSSAANGTAAPDLAEGYIASEKPVFQPWSTTVFRTLCGNDKASDPILGGGTALSAYGFVTLNAPPGISNYYDYAANDGTDKPATGKRGSQIATWPNAILYTNGVLNANDSATWETLTWRLKDSWAGNVPTSYSLRRAVNSDDKSYPHATDWELQSSPDGITWETMDERTNQTFTTSSSATCKLSAQFNYTYNAHIPYLFSAKRATWRFDTFGPVRVAAGATLNLDEIPDANIAFNGLTVDMAAGAGTITKFIPAATGTLTLENVTEAQLKRRFDLPLTFGSVSGTGALANWTVIVNGTPLPNARVYYDAERQRLRFNPNNGMMVIVR